MLVDREPLALTPLPAGYHELYATLLAAIEPDERIRAVWLSGSLARGTADAGSDLDVILTIDDEAFATFAEHWRDWLATITPTVLARQLPNSPGCFTSLTPACLRLDVWIEPLAKLASVHRRRVVVLDRDGLDARVPAPEQRPGPDTTRMAWLVEEFFRQLAVFVPAVLVREDWLCGVVGVQGNRQMLYELFVQANQPQPPMGVKRWSEKLTPKQRAVLEALPPLDTTRASLVPAMQATVQAYATAGRETLAAHGVAWPEELAHAATEAFERGARSVEE